MENAKGKTNLKSDQIDRIALAYNTPVLTITSQDPDIINEYKILDELVLQNKINDEIFARLSKLVDTTENNYGPIDRIMALKLLGNAHYMKRNHSVAIMKHKQALSIAIKFGLNHLCNVIRRNLANSYLALTKYHDVLDLIQTNDVTSQNAVDNAKDLHTLASAYFHIEKWTQAEEAISKALSLLQDLDSVDRLKGHCYQLQGGIRLNTFNHDEAVTLSKKALGLAKLSNDPLGEFYALQVMGKAHLQNKDKLTAKQLFEDAKNKLPAGLNIEEQEIQFYISLCLPDVDESYKKMKEALLGFEQLIVHPRTLAKIYETATEFALEKNRVDDAKYYFKRMRDSLYAIVNVRG